MRGLTDYGRDLRKLSIQKLNANEYVQYLQTGTVIIAYRVTTNAAFDIIWAY